MVRIQNISIKRKLTLIIMTASILAVLIVSAGFIAYEIIALKRGMVRDLQTLAEIIASESTSALMFDDRERAEEILSALKAEKHITAAAFYTDGRLFARYPSEGPTASLPVTPGNEGFAWGDDFVHVVHRVQHKDEALGLLYLQSDLLERDERLKRYAQIVLLFAVISTLVVYYLSTLLQRIVTRPILHLAEKAKTVSGQKDYSVRATKHGNDELGGLIDGFNEMLEQIQIRDTALQQANERLEKRVAERTKILRTEIAERRRAQNGLQQQFTRISLLNQITQAIAARQDTESILHVVLRQLEDHLRLDFGTVGLFNPETQKLNLAAVQAKNSMVAARLDWHEGSAFGLKEAGLELCASGQTVSIADTLKGPAFIAERLGGAGLRSGVSVPLVVEGELFGVLLAARLKPNDFSSGDCEFLRMLSEHVALAAHQANLHAELEHAYNELRQTQRTVMQQERLKALGQMASGIAHDINNALSPVVGFADLLMRMEKGLTVNGRKYLQYIRTAGEDIAHIVTRLREFYRKREDKQASQAVALNALAEQVVDMTRPRWRDIPQERGVTIEVATDLAPGIPEIIGLESEIREALTNLIINAVDALPEGGRITLSTRLQTDSDAPGKRNSLAIVEIADTGTGMTEETRNRCLEPFYSTKGTRGTGLGLAMVYGVMERHDGKIEIDSELGQGSTFRLIFPVRRPVPALASETGSAARIEPLHLLCIDDEPLLRELIGELLSRDGHRVQVCDNGKTGVDCFLEAFQRGDPFDVVITDLGMPYFDGRQVAKAIKSAAPDTPVVLLTGWGAFMKEERDNSPQVDGILSKPPRSGEIREMLQRVMRKAEAGNPVVA